MADALEAKSAVAEHKRGAGRGIRNLAYVTWSTGIGSGLILDGRLYSGTHGSAGELGHMVLDPNGPTCFSLAHCCPVEGVAIGRHVLHAQSNEIATAQLAVDCQIEHRQVACALRELQLGADRPNMRGPQRRLRAGHLSLVPGRSLPGHAG